jgi:hypothetical protein
VGITQALTRTRQRRGVSVDPEDLGATREERGGVTAVAERGAPAAAAETAWSSTGTW